MYVERRKMTSEANRKTGFFVDGENQAMPCPLIRISNNDTYKAYIKYVFGR